MPIFVGYKVMNKKWPFESAGRILLEEETLSFGLPGEKEYYCNECKKWKYKGKTHKHIDCTHCKNGKVTFN